MNTDQIREWVRQLGGKEAVGDALGVTPEAVRKWMQRGLPRCQQVAFFRLLDGRATLEEVEAVTTPVGAFSQPATDPQTRAA